MARWWLLGALLSGCATAAPGDAKQGVDLGGFVASGDLSSTSEGPPAGPGSDGAFLTDGAGLADGAVVADGAVPILFTTSGGSCPGSARLFMTATGHALGFDTSTPGNTLNPSGCSQTFSIEFTSATPSVTGAICTLGSVSAIAGAGSALSVSTAYAGSTYLPPCTQIETATVAGLTVTTSGGVCPGGTVAGISVAGTTLSIGTSTLGTSLTPGCAQTRVISFSP